MQNNGQTVEETRTTEQYGAYQRMADYLNDKLFGGELPQVVLSFSRKTRNLGFFAPDRWTKGGEVSHEISLNPETLQTRSAEDTASTLAHELAHLWQFTFGKPTRNGYHNSEWGEKMDAIGLVPSATGSPGGKRTGQRVSHYIVPGGPFAVAFREMPNDCLLPWLCCAEPAKEKKAGSRSKYTCGGCDLSVWGKKELHLKCGDCDEELTAEVVGGEGKEPEVTGLVVTLVAGGKPDAKPKKLAARKESGSPLSDLPGAVLVKGPRKKLTGS